jgi:hypothetical protein
VFPLPKHKPPQILCNYETHTWRLAFTINKKSTVNPWLFGCRLPEMWFMHLFIRSIYNCKPEQTKMYLEQVYMLLLLQTGSAKGDDAVRTWPITLLQTGKMWIFLPYVTCLYRCNSAAIKRITGKELLNLRHSGHVSSALSLYSVHEPVGWYYSNMEVSKC